MGVSKPYLNLNKLEEKLKLNEEDYKN